MSPLRCLALACAALALQGCLARAAVNVVTLPVRAVGAGVDAVTTSQSEADEKRGREIRKREERLGALDRAYVKEARRCGDGDRAACERAAALSQDIEALTRGEPLPD
jgi:hypothetical protein